MMRALPWSLGLLLALALTGCADGKLFGDSGGLFSGRGGDSGGGGGGDPAICEETYDTTPPGGGSCVTDTIGCGDEVVATTEGGDADFEDEFYTSAFCFVPFEEYGGAERVFALELPADTQAVVTAAFPCGDMGFAAAKWDDSGSCPSESSGVVLCEGLQYGRGGSVTITPFDEATRHLLIVDSPSGQEAPFELRVACEAR